MPSRLIVDLVQIARLNMTYGITLSQETPVGSLLSDLVGYMLSPEWIRIVVYFSYWIIIGGYLFFSYRNIARLQY
ncbi:MAG: hypothetical protein ABSD49_01175 [Candidatus Bathyarchaeia archaeon]